MSNAIGFIRKNGRIIPLRAATGAGHVGKAAGKIYNSAGIANRAANAPKHVQSLKSGEKSKAIKINRALDMTAIGLSVASGVVAAATFAGGWKSLAAGAVASHAIDAAGVAANVGSVAGKGNIKERAKTAGKQEARNFVLGNAIYAAGLVGIKKNRTELAGYAKSILKFGRKALGVAADIE